MNPPGDMAQKAPDRKSSSSMLISAFRSLAVGRRTSTQSPPLSVAASSMTNVAASVDGISTPDSRGEDLEDVLARRRSMLEIKHDSGIDSQHTLVSGAPPELGQLVLQLGQDKPLVARLQAADKIREILRRYHVQDLLPIWVAGNDLLFHESADAVQAALKLLISCIRAAKLNTTERTLFWQSIESYRKEDHIQLRLEAALLLTENGRNITSIEDRITNLVIRLLVAAYNKAADIRKLLKRQQGDPSSVEEQVLARIFQFMSDVIKFNAMILSDKDWQKIISKLASVCNHTTSQADIISSIQMFSLIATFTNISHDKFRPCLRLLCEIYRQLSTLRQQTWTVLQRIFESNLRNYAVEYLFYVLKTPPKTDISSDTTLTTLQGAFQIFRQLVQSDGANGLPHILLPTLAPAANIALNNAKDPKLEVEVLGFYHDVLVHPQLRKRLIDDVDWMYLRESLIQCSTVPLNPLTLPHESPRKTQSTPVKKGSEQDKLEAIKLFHSIIEQLCDMFKDLNVIHQEEAARLFFQMGDGLSDNGVRVLLDYITTRQFLPTKPLDEYRKVWRHLNIHFGRNLSRPTSIRLRTYEILTTRFAEVQYLTAPVVEEFVGLLIHDLEKESEAPVLEVLASFAAQALKSKHREILFDSIMAKVREATFARNTNTSPTSRRPSLAPIPIGRTSNQPSLCRIVVRQIIRLFLVVMNEAASHAEQLYHYLMDVAAGSECDADARICALKLLFRLRSTSDHRVYVAPVSESETIAAVLCRTLNTAVSTHVDELRESSTAQRTSTTAGGQVTKPKPQDIKRTVPPLWLYPGPKGLPQEPSKTPSFVLYSAPPKSPIPQHPYEILKINRWLEIVLLLLQQPGVDWEIYSYVLVHLGAQLKNQTLFAHAVPQIKLLRSVLCDQIRASSFHEPPSHTSVRKADVAVCLFHTLTMLVGYHGHFARSEDDDIIRCFITGLGSYDGSSRWCIHALSICCHELPLSVSKSLDAILQKLAQIITQPHIAIHILEFLCGLARMPDLYKNFREDEYRLVFGVSFRYLQYVRDKRQREEADMQPPSLGKTKRNSDSIYMRRQSTEPDLRAKLREDDLPQYVYALAYHVITFWFMALKLRDRPAYREWIKKSLIYTDSQGNLVVEDQGLVTLDMMDRIAYTDRDETRELLDFARPTDGEVSQKTWIVGMQLVTIRTAGRTGVSHITLRRPVSSFPLD